MGNKFKLIFFFSFWPQFFVLVSSQKNAITLNLEKTFELAINNAIDIKFANSYLNENSFELDRYYQLLKPSLSFQSISPNLSRSIELRPLPDGRDAFVNRSTMYNSLSFELNDRIPSLNAIWYARTSLERLDVFKTDQFPNSKTYFFSPLSVGINLSLFSFNDIVWEQKKLTLEKNESIAQVIDIREEVIGQALILFSECFKLQNQINLLSSQITETDTLYRIKKRLNELGDVSKTELLQLELKKQNNTNDYNQTVVNFNKVKRELCDYINLDPLGMELVFLFPEQLKLVKIDPDFAIDKAVNNNYIRIKQILRKENLEAELERTRKNNGIELSLDASVGFNKTAESLSNIYNNLLDREVISLSVKVPILNSKSIQLAEQVLQEEIYRQNLEEKEEMKTIRRSLKSSLEEYNVLIQKIENSKRAMLIADEIYILARTQFLAGDLSYNNLNLVLRDKIQSESSFYENSFNAFIKYYEIRRLCLYDFIEKTTLTYN